MWSALSHHWLPPAITFLTVLLASPSETTSSNSSIRVPSATVDAILPSFMEGETIASIAANTDAIRPSPRVGETTAPITIPAATADAIHPSLPDSSSILSSIECTVLPFYSVQETVSAPSNVPWTPLPTNPAIMSSIPISSAGEVPASSISSPFSLDTPIPSATVRTNSRGLPVLSTGGPIMPAPSVSTSSILNTHSLSVGGQVTLCTISTSNKKPTRNGTFVVVLPQDINNPSTIDVLPPTETPAPENPAGRDTVGKVVGSRTFWYVISGAAAATLLVVACAVLSVTLVMVRRKKARKQKDISPKLLDAKRRTRRPYDDSHYRQLEMQLKFPHNKTVKKGSAAGSTIRSNQGTSSLEPLIPVQLTKSVKPLLSPPKGNDTSKTSDHSLMARTRYPRIPVLPKSEERNNSEESKSPPQAEAADTLPERYPQMPTPISRKGGRVSSIPPSGKLKTASELGPMSSDSAQAKHPRIPIPLPSRARNNTTPLSLPLSHLGHPTPEGSSQAPVLPRSLPSQNGPPLSKTLSLGEPGHHPRGRYPHIPMFPPSHSTLLEDSDEVHLYETPDKHTTSLTSSDDGYNLPIRWSPANLNSERHYEGYFQAESDRNSAEKRDGPYYNFALIRNSAYAHNMQLFTNPSYMQAELEK